MDQVFDIASKLTLTAALVAAIGAFFWGLILSKGAVERLLAERDKREELLVAERDMWRAAAEAAQKQRDDADDRADRLAEAFETAYRILVRKDEHAP